MTEPVSELLWFGGWWDSRERGPLSHEVTGWDLDDSRRSPLRGYLAAERYAQEYKARAVREVGRAATDLHLIRRVWSVMPTAMSLAVGAGPHVRSLAPKDVFEVWR
jgi:predicted urease superfamily metal-dependent hydrolase